MILKTVVIFGTFDGIHEGHHKFICDAKKHGDRLVAIIARDYITNDLKNKIPTYNELERLNKVFDIEEIDLVFFGDKKHGSYNILREINPDIIFLGYDQQDLYNDLQEKIKNKGLPKINLIFGNPYKPELFHSSILNK